jgi:hypothetical protein
MILEAISKPSLRAFWAFWKAPNNGTSGGFETASSYYGIFCIILVINTINWILFSYRFDFYFSETINFQ